MVWKSLCHGVGRSIGPAFPLACGVCLGQLLAWFLPVWTSAYLVVLWGVLLVVAPTLIRRRFLGVGLGIATALISATLQQPVWSASDTQVLVRIEERPARRVPGEVTFVGREVLGGGSRALRCRAVELPWRHASELERGDVVWVRGAITPLKKPLNPFSWDGWLWRRGVTGEMRALFVSQAVHKETSAVDTLRNAIRSRVARVTDDSRGGALVLSMAFGERDVLSSHVENAFKAVGMSHLLVVSGYQVSLVFGVVYVVCMQVRGLLGAHAALRLFATWCALVCCGGYVLLVGSEMSSVRALMAASCLCVALVLDRAHRFGQRWATALLFMQVVYPWALFEVGVILTFAALAGIGVGSILGGRSVWRSYAWVTVCTWLMTSSVTVVWNGSFSFVGLLLNLALAAPWSIWNCAVGGGALCLAAVYPSIGEVPLTIVAWGNEVVVAAVLGIVGNAQPHDPLSGAARWTTAALLVVASAWATWRAVRRAHETSMRALAR